MKLADIFGLPENFSADPLPPPLSVCAECPPAYLVLINSLHCRYITIMTYMNDVEEGGETAFVSADNSTFDKDVSICNNEFMKKIKGNPLLHHRFVNVYKCGKKNSV